jgi:uncharacterized protein (TIGR02246 family)
MATWIRQSPLPATQEIPQQGPSATAILKHREETMKVRLLLTLAGLAIGFAVPVPAQEKNTVDPEVLQQIEAVYMKYDEAYNKNDVAAMAALFTQDALQVWQGASEGGTASGQQAIEKRYAVDFASAPSAVRELVQVYAIGNDICAIAEYKSMVWKGHIVTIYVRVGRVEDPLGVRELINDTSIGSSRRTLQVNRDSAGSRMDHGIN